MRYLKLILLSTTLVLGGLIVPGESIQNTTQVQSNAQEKANRLRSQLSEVEARQSELQTRLTKLEEDLKPENIEHGLAGVGSTKPEDLREQRRRQLEIERNGVRAQLDLLGVSHTRLETAIAAAEADAYRQSAEGVIPADASSTNTVSTASTPVRPRRAKKKKKRKSRRPRQVQKLAPFSAPDR